MMAWISEVISLSDFSGACLQANLASVVSCYTCVAEHCALDDTPSLNDSFVRQEVKCPSFQDLSGFTAGDDQDHLLQLPTHQPVCKSLGLL